MRDLLLAAESIRSVEWREGAVHVLDQRALPTERIWLVCENAGEVAELIRDMAVRGAAAVAICAAYAVVMSARARFKATDDWLQTVYEDVELLGAARPAVFNLFNVLASMRDTLQRHERSDDLLGLLEAEAVAIHQADREANLCMAEAAVELIQRHQGGAQNLMVHGNVGALATGGFGTALGVVRAAVQRELVVRIYTGEAQPMVSGVCLTAWELVQEGVPVTQVADSAVAHLLRAESITWLILAAERLTANGDLIGTVGSYQLAVTAMHHGVRVMAVVPSTSIDMATGHGDDVVLEAFAAGSGLASERLAAGVEGFSPAFDVTPADLIDFLVTERGVVDRPDEEKLAQLMCRKRLH